jgi:4-alpha-glucanotransferase
MSFPRAAGILLHPTSLPSRGGIGDFGPAAYQFADFSRSARQGLWQVLPLGPLGYGNSPYSSTSAFAGNPLLISLERLASHGWIDQANSHLSSDSGRGSEYDQVFATKMPLLFEGGRGFVRRLRPARANALSVSVRRTPGGWTTSSCSMRCARGKSWRAGMNGRQNLAHREAGAIERARKDWRTTEDPQRPAVCFLRTVAGSAALLFGALDSHRGRRCHLCELR